MLLHPGTNSENQFKSFLADHYSVDEDGNLDLINHQCKMGFVSVLNGSQLSDDVGEDVLHLLGF